MAIKLIATAESFLFINYLLQFCIKIMKTVLFILIGLLIFTQPQLLGKSDLNGIASGFVAFTVSSPNEKSLQSSTYHHNFPIPLSKAPRVAIGILATSFSSSQSSPLDFQLYSNNSTVSSVVFAFIRQAMVWEYVQISFIASARDDVILGSSSIITGNLNSKSFNKIVQVGLVKNFQTSIGRVFLNGVKLGKSSAFQVQVETRRVLPSAIQVLVDAGPNCVVTTVYLSYFIVNPQTTPDISMSGGNIVINRLFGIGHYQTKNNNQLSTPYINGISKIGSSLTLGLRADIDIDSILTVQQSGPPLDVVFTYIFLGVRPQSFCAAYEDQRYSYYQTCVKKCPADSFPKAFQCRKCSQKLNLIINSEGNGCECAQGSNLKDGNCIFDQSTPIYNSLVTKSLRNSGQFISSGIFKQDQVMQNRVSSTGAVVSVSSNGQSLLAPTGPIVLTRTQTTAPVSNPQVQGGINVNVNVNNIQANSNTNSYPATQPSQPGTFAIVPTPVVISNATSASTLESCVNFANTYWTGYRCSCRVGFKLDITTGQCVRINLVIPANPIPVAPRCRENEVLSFNVCVCIQNFAKNQHGRCVPVFNTECQPNSYFDGQRCVCNDGYYQDQFGKCSPKSYCPPYSEKGRDGNCKCIDGYKEIEPNVCRKCDKNTIWINGDCVAACGVNEQYNPTTQKCECISGYGYLNYVCSVCTGDFFLVDGYCVVCPIYSTYNIKTNRCQCSPGHNLVYGKCVPICKSSEVYDQTSKSCKCKQGLGILPSGQCGVCPEGTVINPLTSKCGPCSQGQVLQGTTCVCKTGFGLSESNKCIDCAAINANLISGYCVKCPIGKIWKGSSCDCEDGKVDQGGICVPKCKPDQLVDFNGNCYYCRVNEHPEGGACVCNDGFAKDPSSQICQLGCPPNQFIINGVCGVCVMGTEYNNQLKACVCKDGWYKNIHGSCEKKDGTICDSGFYLTPQKTCLACPAGCQQCTSAIYCTKCILPLVWSNGNCNSVPPPQNCGNGAIDSGETCDDRNTAPNDGCSSTCQQEPGYFCVGTPSYCRPVFNNLCGNGVINPGETCDDRNRIGNDGCSSTCQQEPGYNCVGTPSYCRPIVNHLCGNGNPDAGQECDDKNGVGNDGCSSTCKLQPGYTCTPNTYGRPSVCTPNLPSSGITFLSFTSNVKTIYVKMRVDRLFTFANEAEMTQFMKYNFHDPTQQPISGYCRQSQRDQYQFQCLFNYSKLPQQAIGIRFFYNKDGFQGFLQTNIEPKKNSNLARQVRN